MRNAASVQPLDQRSARSAHLSNLLPNCHFPEVIGVPLRLYIKREGIDRRWQIAPYEVRSYAEAEKLIEFVRPTVPVPFEWKVTTERIGLRGR